MTSCERERHTLGSGTDSPGFHSHMARIAAWRLFSTDDEEEEEADSEGSLVPSTAIVTEGGQFRLMVRFDGTIPIRGTCTISLSDSGGHAMSDVTATANGFDASTELITGGR